MRDALGPGTILGYCTNVHAGATLDETMLNLAAYAARVRMLLGRDDPMGVGLWLSADAAREAVALHRIEELRAHLSALGLLAFTFNGFPYGDFHQPVVKHTVYRPDWGDPRRQAYTLDLARILAALLDEGDEGSISTLPFGWNDNAAPSGRLLHSTAEALRRIEADTGRIIHLDLEPEPGCVMQDGRSTIDAYERLLAHGGDEAVLRRHVRVCHDVCHTSVMFEDQRTVLQQYRDAGIAVGKVQISNAIHADLAEDRAARLGALAAFAEDCYLHQTVARVGDGSTRFHDDLPEALAAVHDHDQAWRVHFHVPVDLERFGVLGTTRSDVETVLSLRDTLGCRHFEVETYAWDVLPPELREDDLAAGIARELQFVLDQAT